MMMTKTMIPIPIMRREENELVVPVVCTVGVAVGVDIPVVAVAATDVVGVDDGASSGGASGGRSGRLLSGTGSLTAGLS